jgi:hypothetical protein
MMMLPPYASLASCPPLFRAHRASRSVVDSWVSRYLPNVNNPTSWGVDTLIEKRTQIRESVRLTFRAELFNTFNAVIFSGPTTSITSATFGHAGDQDRRLEGHDRHTRLQRCTPASHRRS